jgi:heptosyltransferase-2
LAVRYLICRTDRLGDVILSFPVASILKRTDPEAFVVYLVNPYAAPLLENNPYIDHWMTVRVRGEDRGGILNLKEFRTTLKRVKELAFDVALALHSKPTVAQMLFLSGIKMRIGPKGRYYSFLYTHRVKIVKGIHITERNLGFLRAIGLDGSIERPKIYLRSDERERGEELWRGKSHPRVVLHLSARTAKTWPQSNFFELARRFIKSKVSIALTGRFKGAPVEGALPFRENLSLRDLISLLSQSDAVVTGATGIMHIAAAIDIPLFAIFDPSIPYLVEEWEPLGKEKTLYLPKKRLDEIEPERVFRDVINLLERKGLL